MTTDSQHPPFNPAALEGYGWQAFFAEQVDAAQCTATPPVRVVEVHRSGLRVVGDGIAKLLPARQDVTVGDWLLLNTVLPTSSVLLERKTLFRRRAAGTGRVFQLIAANVDTVFIVTSCNQDFNVARLERYAALALDAGVTPVFILTKADLCDDPEAYRAQAETISDRIKVLVLNAKAPEVIEALLPWCGAGQTVSFLGSSGVGKSTLVNTLLEAGRAATAGIREDDAKGRHTTTYRHMHFLANGCAVLDTPGMRELQMADLQGGIADLFADLEALASTCKFRDCKHQGEPGCALQAALEAQEIDADRVERWKKLVTEETFNSVSMQLRKTDDRKLAKLIRETQGQKTSRKRR